MKCFSLANLAEILSECILKNGNIVDNKYQYVHFKVLAVLPKGLLFVVHARVVYCIVLSPVCPM